MSVSAPRRKVEDLEAQIAAHWEHQSELTLHRMLRDATMLFPKSDLEETQRLHIVNGMVWLRLKNPREAAASFKAVLDIGERG
ncbi:MAG TPA: hypothetical protein PKY30_27050, partial [Myxococcota bacterium]|nr:hypothetical protein [Myxococcota bacterium]